MSQPGTRQRAAADACPGVTRPFTAADGAIVRLRTGGLPVAVDSLRALLDVAAAEGDPSILLTSRGALQVRGLPDPVPEPTRARIAATGFVPSATHELVRNVVVSPLTGLDGRGHVDLRPLVRDLDAAICDDPHLARLPGRFLHVLDDGRGDVIGESFDLGLLATAPDRCTIHAGTTESGWEVDLRDAVPALVALARAFLGLRAAGGSPAWHVAELAEPLLLPALGSPRPTVAAATASAGPRPTHPVGAVRGHAVAGVPLGLLTRAHVDAVAAATDRVVVTPWRSLVLEDAAAHLEALAASGLITASDSPWLRLHACTGLPGCARSALDTRALARELAPRMPPGSLPVHVSGCERRCGTPRSGYVDLLTPASADSALALIPSEPR